MRTLLALLVLALAAPASAQVPQAKGKARATPASAAPEVRFRTPDDILRFIDGYKATPKPGEVPGAVKAMSRLGVFKEIDNAGVYLGFIGGVLGANAPRAGELVDGMFPMPPEDQVAIVKGIAYSGIPEWKALLRLYVERMPARQVLIDRYLTDKLKPLDQIGLETGPATLDANWGFYFATGSAAALVRIESALSWAEEKDDVEKLTIAGMAKWTLARNAQRDPDLLAVLKKHAATQTKVIGKELREIIEAVETFETGKLRKDAVARIDELKMKGGASKRSQSWWAQAGVTALALGCVAASALGQVEFGLPCVIGGPLAQGAAKLFTSQ